MKNMTIDHTVEVLRANGARLTPLRLALVKLFFSQRQPLSALDILQSVFGHKTSIYRELDFLLANGIIMAVDFGDQVKRYELASRHHHHHVVCTNCKKIVDVELKPDLHQQEKRLGLQTGFKITDHSLEFFGLCSACQ